MTNGEIIKMIDGAIKELDKAIETLQKLTKPNKSCEDDLIWRRDAAKQFCNDCKGLDEPCEHQMLCQTIKVLNSLPSAEPKKDDENELKFYYVESLDDYWVGRRLDNFYYADWHDGLGFVWSHSRYLPWGEHIVDENTLWKEHTYPSEPIEVPFTEWIVGFVQKYFAKPKTKCIAQFKIDRDDIEDLINEKVNEIVDKMEVPKIGKWVIVHGYVTPGGDPVWKCSECGKGQHVYGIEADTYGADIAEHQWVACPNCGAIMVGESGE